MSSVKPLFKAIFSCRGFVALLFVLFFVVSIIQSWRIEMLRENAIRTLEKNRRSRVIVLIHREETINMLGIPVVRYINIEDSEDVLGAIRLTDKNMPLEKGLKGYPKTGNRGSCRRTAEGAYRGKCAPRATDLGTGAL